MAKIYPLFSSSSGNSHFIGSRDGGILIDAGASCTRLVQALGCNDIPPEAVRAVFITHDHTDHISGLRVFLKSFKPKVYASPGTLRFLEENGHIPAGCAAEAIEGSAETNGFFVTAFKTPHDAVDSVGYKIHTPDGKSLCVCTDLGKITPTVHDCLKYCDLVLLESNYDETMLRNGKYPFILKKRIASEIGHLSNSDSAKEVRELISLGTTRIILGHLSRENNTPRIAENTLLRELSGEYVKNRDFLLTIAPVQTGGLGVAF